MKRNRPRIEHESIFDNIGGGRLDLILNPPEQSLEPEFLPQPNIKRALLLTALFVLFLIIITVLELALR